MASCRKLFQFAEASNRAASWRQHCLACFFSALLAHAFPQEDGIMLRTHSTGGLFNLSRLRAKTKTKHVLIHELLYADDAALVAHSEVHLQNLCERFAKACNDVFAKACTVWKMVACPRIPSTASSITHLVELADPNCATKTSSSVTWQASTSLHSHGKHLLPIATDGVPL